MASKKPEHQAPPEIFYNEDEAAKYTSNTRIMQIQSEMSERALELLALPEDKSCYLLDIGCGSGLSGDCCEEQGHTWVGVDISQAMLDIARERESESGDVMCSDMGQGLGFRAGTFDGAISISALQWLCNADKSWHNPHKRLYNFFSSLYACLSRGSRAVLQFYPENPQQVEMITHQSMKAGFTGGLVVDYPNSTKAKKFFLVLMTGGAQPLPQALGQEVAQRPGARFETKRDRVKQIRGNKNIKKSRDWILDKKERARKKDKTEVSILVAMSTECNQAEVFARVDFPLYSIAMVSPRHVLVAGGGGSANTGVKNGYEIFEVTTDGEAVRGETVSRHFTGEFSIYSLAVRASINNNLPHSVLLAAGHNQYCQLYRLSLHTEKHGGSQESSLTNRRSNGVLAGSGVQEHFSSPPIYRSEQLKKVQIDYNQTEPYGKVVRVSLNGKFLATGGDDGHLRVFSFPDLDSVHDFATHDKEIDDIDFSPDSSKICSISKDKRAIVWDVKKGKKHAELGWDCPNNVKYLYKRLKFGCVEGDIKKYKIYTISNPIGSSKAPSFLHRWNTQSYTVEQAVSTLGNAYSALAVSDNGNFVATGTMSEGVVEIYTAFNLSRVKRVRNSHSTFITGMEFLPTTEQSAICRAFKEASVISISVDHQVCIHHVPELATVSSLTAMLFVVLVLLATFILSSFLGL